MAIEEPAGQQFDSFISEHTAEYGLIPDISRILSSSFKRIIPFYFWSLREGNRTSLEASARLAGRLIAIYGRRPKIQPGRPDHIYVKINSSLFTHASYYAQCHIPVLAGVPVVNSIGDLGTGCKCAWYHIPGNVREPVDEHLHCNGFENQSSSSPCNTNGPLSESEIIQLIMSETRQQRWGDVIDSLKCIRRNLPRNKGLFWLNTGYKPFFLFLLEQLE